MPMASAVARTTSRCTGRGLTRRGRDGSRPRQRTALTRTAAVAAFSIISWSCPDQDGGRGIRSDISIRSSREWPTRSPSVWSPSSRVGQAIPAVCAESRAPCASVLRHA